jgi:MoxR-like ATPase
MAVRLTGDGGPESVVEIATATVDEIAAAVTVPELAVRTLLVALLARGHVLIEDLPGVGKTALARALASATGCRYARIQCTSDMLPSDVTGVNVFNEQQGRFEFRAGPVFANVVLVDEINRASAKTQSGLLECMQEQRVTVEGQTHALDSPFIVIATQNPVDFEGTYPLPVAQLDRFMARLSLGYPAPEDEAEMLARQASHDRVLDVRAVMDAAQILAAQSAVAAIHASEPLRRYIVELLEATRRDERIEFGASPRAGLHLLRAAMALAAMRGRDHVLPDDVQDLAVDVLSHRLVPGSGAARVTRGQLVRDALARVPAL